MNVEVCNDKFSFISKGLKITSSKIKKKHTVISCDNVPTPLYLYIKKLVNFMKHITSIIVLWLGNFKH
jgi:hypothetical protein